MSQDSWADLIRRGTDYRLFDRRTRTRTRRNWIAVAYLAAFAILTVLAVTIVIRLPAVIP